MDKHLKKYVLIFVLVCYPFIFGITQQNSNSIIFDKTIHDFGTIKEANGSVDYIFHFTNKGTSDVIIQEVMADCGCTTTGWTEIPVKPGEKGFVKAVYDPNNRPGSFDKFLSVFFDGIAEPVELIIEGSVEPIPRSTDELYPVTMGGIRVKKRNIILGKITNEKPVTKKVSVYNEMNKSVSFDREIEAPDHISVQFLPKTIPAKSFGIMEVTYDPRGIELFGYKGDRLEIKSNEWFDSRKKFRIVAFLEEYFPPLTDSALALAPKLKIENPVYDFGKIEQGATSTHEFVITNTGQDELNIRMTRASCGCTSSEPEKNNLKPGESSIIKVTFNSEGKEGDQSEIILVFSNDPSNPTQKITFKGTVKEAESF